MYTVQVNLNVEIAAAFFSAGEVDVAQQILDVATTKCP